MPVLRRHRHTGISDASKDWNNNVNVFSRRVMRIASRLLETFCLAFIGCALSATNQGSAQPVSQYKEVAARLPNGWNLYVSYDGAASLVFGSGDVITLPEGEAVPQKEWFAEFARAIEAAKPAPEDSPERVAFLVSVEKAKFFVSIVNLGEVEGKIHRAVFTPEIREYVSMFLAHAVSERIRSITNLHPVFSVEHLDLMAVWTNSELSRAPGEGSVLAVSPTGQAPSAMASPISRVLAKNPAASDVVIPVEPLREAEDSSFGVRGWIIAVLLAIAVFLGYRFVRLRLGS